MIKMKTSNHSETVKHEASSEWQFLTEDTSTIGAVFAMSRKLRKELGLNMRYSTDNNNYDINRSTFPPVVIIDQKKAEENFDGLVAKSWDSDSEK